MNPQTIGTSFPHGFSGCYARQPDMIVNTYRNAGQDPIVFGTALFFDTNGDAVLPISTTTANKFAGITAVEVKTSMGYPSPSNGVYYPGEPMAVMARGRINVKCQKGTPAHRGDVYVRIAANATYPNAVVGGIEAEADGDNTIKLTNCVFGGGKDNWNICELIILSLLTPNA